MYNDLKPPSMEYWTRLTLSGQSLHQNTKWEQPNTNFEQKIVGHTTWILNQTVTTVILLHVHGSCGELGILNKNSFSNYDILTLILNNKKDMLPISFPFPSGQTAHNMISVPDATATILSLSPSDPPMTLALSATRSMIQSNLWLENTCCHPVDSLTLKGREKVLSPICNYVS